MPGSHCPGGGRTVSQRAAIDTTLSASERQAILRSVEAMPKVDAHVHFWTIAPEDQEALVRFLAQHNWRWMDTAPAE